MTSPLTFTVAEAAARLGGPFTVDFLKGHLHEIPHIKTGAGRGRSGRVAFSEQHLIRIVDMFTVAPVEPQPATRYASMAHGRSGPRRRSA